MFAAVVADTGKSMMPRLFSDLLTEVRACQRCADILQPRPVLRLSPQSRVLVVGQAPGSRVHASGKPWDDASGDHLLEWLSISRETFSDPTCFGILPMAFCYPGRGKSGDLPPPPVCAQTWHGPLLEGLERPALILLIGQYAQRCYLPGRQRTLTETVRSFKQHGPRFFPLPHPSWRSRGWMKRNPWFAAEVLPVLRTQVAAAISG